MNLLCSFVRLLPLVGGLLVLSACQQEAQEVTELKRVTLPEEDAPPELSTEQRLLLAPLDSAAQNVLYQWQLPAGWKSVALRSNFYLASFEAPGGIRCDIASSGGGVEPNLQRWYAQFSQTWPAQGLESFERITLSGLEGYLIQLSGRYQPVGQGRPAQNNTGLLGAVAATGTGQQVLSVKMTGKEDLVAAELENFRAFCASLQRSTGD